MATLVAVCLLGLNAVLLACLIGQARQQAVLVGILRSVRATLAQLREAELRKVELLEKQVLAERAIDAGSIGVETVHKAIAGLTFGILESIPSTRATAAVVREAHDAGAAGSYAAVRTLNREVGKLLKDALGALPEDRGRDDRS